MPDSSEIRRKRRMRVLRSAAACGAVVFWVVYFVMGYKILNQYTLEGWKRPAVGLSVSLGVAVLAALLSVPIVLAWVVRTGTRSARKVREET